MKPTPKTNSVTSPTKTLAAGSASIAALLAASVQQADAQITVGGTGFTVEDTSFGWDVDGNGSTDLQIADFGNSMAIYSPGGTLGGNWMLNGSYILAAVATTAMVSVGANFGNGGYISQNGNLGSNAIGFESVAASFVGFRFKILTETHYGWAKLTPTFGAENSIQINQWAYNSIADGAIQVGAVPEPAAAATGLGLLALGAAGLRRQRRHNSSAA
jgi:MYXO-CTERM domain-containing protein